MAIKLAKKLEYEAKQTQLRSLVELEARRLQGVQEAKMNAERDIKEINERKEKVLKSLDKMRAEIAEMQEAKENMAREKSELNVFKEYITELLGRLTSYKTAVDETVKYANEMLKKNGVPLTFGQAPDEIMKITFENFDKYE